MVLIFFRKRINFHQKKEKFELENYLCYDKTRRMKRILCFIAALGMGAQAVNAQVKLGPEAGVTYNTMLQKINGVDYDTKYQFGVRMGAVVDIPLSPALYLQPGVAFSAYNGGKSTYTRYYASGEGIPTRVYDQREYQVSYINIPVYFMYKTGRNFDDNHFFVGLGPFMNIAIAGRFDQIYTTTLNGLDRPVYYDRALNIGDFKQQDDHRRIDVGVNVMLGYEFSNGLFFRGYYGTGLLNMAPGADMDNRFRHMGGGLTVGFLIPTQPRQTWGWR
jgi:hypothetical protein